MAGHLHSSLHLKSVLLYILYQFLLCLYTILYVYFKEIKFVDSDPQSDCAVTVTTNLSFLEMTMIIQNKGDLLKWNSFV